MARLDFIEPDYDRFPCLGLAHRALAEGGTTACAVNTANRVANEAFRQSRIAFTDIYRIIDHTLDRMDNIAAPSLDGLHGGQPPRTSHSCPSRRGAPPQPTALPTDRPFQPSFITTLNLPAIGTFSFQSPSARSGPLASGACP